MKDKTAFHTASTEPYAPPVKHVSDPPRTTYSAVQTACRTSDSGPDQTAGQVQTLCPVSTLQVIRCTSPTLLYKNLAGLACGAEACPMNQSLIDIMLPTPGHCLRKAKVGSTDSMARGIGSVSSTKLRILEFDIPKTCNRHVGHVKDLVGHVKDLGISCSQLQVTAAILSGKCDTTCASNDKKVVCQQHTFRIALPSLPSLWARTGGDPNVVHVTCCAGICSCCKLSEQSKVARAPPSECPLKQMLHPACLAACICGSSVLYSP